MAGVTTSLGAKEFTSIGRHWWRRLLEAARVVWGRGAKKSSGVLSYLISTSLPTSSTLGVSQKLVGGLQQEKVRGHTGEGQLPGRCAVSPSRPPSGAYYR